MSRTDAHTPYLGRVARREVTVVPVHRCAGRQCDLPALDADWSIGRVGRVGRAGSCYWEFAYTGVNVCCCWMCHWHRRTEQRRAAVRTELRAAAREWNAGDR